MTTSLAKPRCSLVEIRANGDEVPKELVYDLSLGWGESRPMWAVVTIRPLEVSWVALTHIDVHGNHLRYLPSLPPNLRVLWCFENLLEAIPPPPPSLLDFWCGYNPLKTLPDLPRGLVCFACDGCPTEAVSGLKELPETLEEFVCSFTGIDALPTLPSGLKKLSAWGCPLKTLPPFPPSLEVSLGPELRIRPT